MKKSINVNSLKGVEFFLGGVEKVDSLESGARKNGGATLFKNGVFSNYDNKKNDIIVDSKKNTISIIIPSTLDADKEIDNKEYVNYYSSIIKNCAKFKNVFFYNSYGSWYSDNLNKVIVEKKYYYYNRSWRLNNKRYNVYDQLRKNSKERYEARSRKRYCK